MKKKLFVAFALVFFSGVVQAKLKKVSKVYVTNETLTEWDRGPVYKYTGEKFGLWLTSRWGKKRSLPDYICKYTGVPAQSCIYKQRFTRPKTRSGRQVVTSKPLRILPMNYGERAKNVEILQINRDQSKTSQVNIQKETGRSFSNPDSKKFKIPNKQWLYPYERIKTVLTAKDGSGKIVLDLTSERVGIHVDAYQAALEAENVGFTGKKELAEAETLGVVTAIGGAAFLAQFGPAIVVAPLFVVGGIPFAVTGLISGIKAWSTMAKRSGLVVRPYVQGNYEVFVQHGKPIGTPGHLDNDDIYIYIRKLDPEEVAKREALLKQLEEIRSGGK